MIAGSGQDLTSRNHINILSSELIVALPGGPGTLSEVQLAQIYAKPAIAFLGAEAEAKSIGGLSTEEDLGIPCAHPPFLRCFDPF